MFIQILLCIIAAVVAYWFGLQTYKDQKSLEDFHNEFVNEGIKTIWLEVNDILLKIRELFQLGLKISKALKEIEVIKWDLTTFEPLFLKVAEEPPHLGKTNIYKLTFLIGEDDTKIIYEQMQLLYSLLSEMNQLLSVDLKSCIRLLR